LEANHPGHYWCEQGCEDPWTFWNPKGAREQKSMGNSVLDNENLLERLFK